MSLEYVLLIAYLCFSGYNIGTALRLLEGNITSTAEASIPRIVLTIFAVALLGPIATAGLAGYQE